MPTFADCLIVPEAVWDCADCDLPLGFVALDGLAKEASLRALPPFPLIGIEP